LVVDQGVILRERIRTRSRFSLSWTAPTKPRERKMTGHEDYHKAMELLDENMKALNGGHDDPILWNLSTALFHLAQGLQRDMEKLHSRLAAIDNKISSQK
jgi:hypothetical protein